MNLWIVGQYRSGQTGSVVWEFAGVFDSEQLAIDACRDETYFVAPATLNEIITHEFEAFPGCRYPKAKF
jgi:hypothetical protein